MHSTVTAIPRAKRQGSAAHQPQAQRLQVLGAIDTSAAAETTRLTFDEIESLLVRIHSRTDAIKACTGLAGADAGKVEMSREQFAALLDLLAEGVKTVAYELQETVGSARRQLGMYRQPQFGQF